MWNKIKHTYIAQITSVTQVLQKCYTSLSDAPNVKILLPQETDSLLDLRGDFVQDSNRECDLSLGLKTLQPCSSFKMLAILINSRHEQNHPVSTCFGGICKELVSGLSTTQNKLKCDFSSRGTACPRVCWEATGRIFPSRFSSCVWVSQVGSFITSQRNQTGELTDTWKISTSMNKTSERGTSARDSRLLRKQYFSF